MKEVERMLAAKDTSPEAYVAENKDNEAFVFNYDAYENWVMQKQFGDTPIDATICELEVF